MDAHKATHKLIQVYADLALAEQEVRGLDADSERKHRAVCFIREAAQVVQHVVDNDLAVQLTKGE